MYFMNLVYIFSSYSLENEEYKGILTVYLTVLFVIK